MKGIPPIPSLKLALLFLGGEGDCREERLLFYWVMGTQRSRKRAGNHQRNPRSQEFPHATAIADIHLRHCFLQRLLPITQRASQHFPYPSLSPLRHREYVFPLYFFWLVSKSATAWHKSCFLKISPGRRAMLLRNSNRSMERERKKRPGSQMVLIGNYL